MSVRSLPLAVVVAEECGNGVRIGVGAEKFPQRHSLLPGEVENQPAQSGVANPQAYSAIAQQPSLHGRLVLATDVLVLLSWPWRMLRNRRRHAGS